MAVRWAVRKGSGNKRGAKFGGRGGGVRTLSFWRKEYTLHGGSSACAPSGQYHCTISWRSLPSTERSAILDDGVTPGIPGFFGEPAGSACALHAAMRRKRSWKSIAMRRKRRR